MNWWAIDVQASPGRREALAAWLVAHTGQAVEEREDGTLVSVVPDANAAEALLGSLVEQDSDVRASRRELDPIDWSTRWRDGLAPRSFGPLTVVPSWVAYRAKPGESVIVLDPETAFGSGEHGSTRAALQLLVDLVCTGDAVLDLGSGSGILSIAAAQLGASRAVGIELDGEAILVAERNAERNQVTDRVSFVLGDARLLVPLLRPADLVIANILRTVNVELLPAIRDVLKPRGKAIFSGMEEGEAALFRPELAGAGLREVRAIVDAGWWAVAVERP
jgi:ribosomal protein L11 methyltransferase